VKPDDQLVLTDAELNEEHARILTAANHLIPQNIVRFSYKASFMLNSILFFFPLSLQYLGYLFKFGKEKKFKQVTNIDQTCIHLQVYGNLVAKDTDDARAYEKFQKSYEENKRKNMSKDILDEYVDEDGNKLTRILRNKFNSIDRAIQTHNRTFKVRRRNLLF
jgi:dynein intermediate chain 1